MTENSRNEQKVKGKYLLGKRRAFSGHYAPQTSSS